MCKVRCMKLDDPDAVVTVKDPLALLVSQMVSG